MILHGMCTSAPGAHGYHNLCPGEWEGMWGQHLVCKCACHVDNTLTGQVKVGSACDNETSPQGASTPAGTDHRSFANNERG